MTADEDDIMTFKADVIRDPMKDIDDMVVLGEIGSFGKARALFEESLAQYSDAFPISAEYLRLLYDQGDYTSLKNADSYIPKPRTGADGTVLAWSSDQEMVVDLMCKSGEAHYHSHSKEIHDVIEIETEDVFRRCQAFELEKLTEEQTLSLVLLCKLLYWRHEHHRSVHDVNFEFDGHSPQKLVEHFLRRKNYWAAENLLQICFRRTSEDHQEIHIEQIWESIEGFLVETEADQSRGVLLARIAVLESFCENLLRRELALQDNEPNEHRRWSWETAMEALTKSVNAFAKLEDIETSRISLRKQLIDFDKSSETQSLDSSSAAEMPDPQILHALLQHAHENDDRQLKDGINWRIDVLVHHREPRGMSTPALVPFTIYQRLWYLAMDVSQLASHAQQNGVEESEIPEFMLSTACRLYHAYQQSRELRQLDHAIESANIGIEFTNQSGSLYAAYLANIGVFLKTRYERTGQMQDLDNSIQAARQAVDMIPLDHPDLAGRLNNLGNRLWSRYQRMGQRQDLDDAIQAARQAVDATTVDHSNRVAMLSNLGMWLGSRYVRTGQMQDLDDAIHAARQAVDATPLDHPNRAGRLNSLGISLGCRYQRMGQRQDLEDAIAATRQAVDVTPVDHPDRSAGLNNLGNWLGNRYQRMGQRQDLDDAINASRQAVDATPLDRPEHVTWLNNLGNWLRIRYQQTGKSRDLEDAIHAARQAVYATPSDHPDRAGMLNNLGLSLGSRYKRTGQIHDLEDAISMARQAVDATALDHPEHGVRLSNLSIWFGSLYERTGQMQDLDNSIQAARQAVDMIPLDHPDLAGRLNNLGNRLWSRYQRMGQRQDLDDAIQAARQAVDATTVDHSNRVAMLSNLGMWLEGRYVRTGQMQDLDDAIHAARQAVDATPLDHPNRAGRSNNLGICLHSRYQQTGKSRDLEDAIHAARQAVDATPSDHPDRAGMLNNLGNWLGIRYKRTEQMLDLEDASRCHLQAYDCTAAVPLTRVRAAAGGLTKLANLDRVHEAIVLGKGALALLPIVRARNLDLSDQQFMLSGFAGIASNLCALLLSEGRVHEAVEFLEQGRAVIISQLLDDRSDLTDLSEDHPQLCQRYQVLVNEVNSPFGGGNDNTTATIAKITRRREAVTELEACIADIRASPKYERFLLGPTIDEMQDSIDDGCVVIVNVSQLGCDAVILSKKSLQAIPLSELRVEIATSWLSKKWQSKKSERREKNDEFLKYLAWLWRVCAQPILDHVSALYTQQIKTHPPPRVWWIGCGFACSMPFHAAGIHNDKSEENVFSRVLSSYTPSIKALGYARDQMTNAWSDLSVRNQMLITLMPKTPKLGALKGVLDETDDIIRIVSPHMSPDVCPTPDAETVLRHLEKCEIAHFACHGTSDSIDPSNSGLVLQRDAVDGRPEQDHLSVHRISRLQLRHAKIAYLSACSTAENKNVRLRDEVIHIVSGFQVAGFPHVIGSLWPAGDAECVQVASGFYSKLFKDGGVSGIGDRQVACALQEAVMAVRAGNLDMPLNWAQYVHFGA